MNVRRSGTDPPTVARFQACNESSVFVVGHSFIRARHDAPAELHGHFTVLGIQLCPEGHTVVGSIGRPFPCAIVYNGAVAQHRRYEQ